MSAPFAKIIELGDRFPTGEPTLMVVQQRGHAGWLTESAKLASVSSPALDYVRNVAPEDGHTIILVNALGAFETYDDNRNGDGFPELPYNVGLAPTCGHAQCQTRDGWIAPGDVLTQHYLSFEKRGHVFEHHINKDPTRALGSVLRAFWNARMHRVELLLRIVNNRKPELIQRINDGDFPAVSMGCHVRYDVCSVCGHRAPTRREYCEHLRMAMRRIDPKTGLRFCALNPCPSFFDISIVVRPADTTGYMLKKVAEAAYAVRGWELGEKVAAVAEKQALVRKLSDIQKHLVGETLAARVAPEKDPLAQYRRRVQKELLVERPAAGEREYRAMDGFAVPEVVSTLADKQAALAADEFATLLLRRLGVAATPAQLDKVALLQPLVYEVFAQRPDLYEKVAGVVEVHPRLVRAALAERLAGWVEKRAGFGDWVRHRAQPSVGGAGFGPSSHYEAHAPGRTDVLSMADPNTGEVYKTTRGAVQTAQDRNWRSYLGTAALMSGAYTVGLSLAPFSRNLPLATRTLLSFPLGLASARGVQRMTAPDDGVRYLTDQGIEAPGATEFRKSGALAPTTVLDKLSQDYVNRLGAVPDASLHAALVAKMAHDGTLDGATRALCADTSALGTRVRGLLAPLEKAAEDAISLPPLDFDAVAAALGRLF